MNRTALLIPRRSSIILSLVVNALSITALGLLMAYAVLGSAGWL